MAISAYSAAVTLQPHQQYTLDYLNKHGQQKGLLLYHALGTGKTYLSIAFAESLPTHKVMVVLPRFLKGNWLTQIKSYGAKNPDRYELVSLEDAWQVVKDRDLSQTVLIIDEVHKLIDRVRYAPAQVGEQYGKLYEKLKSAHKVVLLTGTPIFTNASDFAYIGNLLVADDRFPFNPEKFRQEFLAIKPTTSLWRGYVTESKTVGLWLPFWATLGAVLAIATTSAPVLTIPLVAFTGSAIIPQFNEWFPVHQTSFREFRAERLAEFADQYVSYYVPTEEMLADYPQKEIITSEISYNTEQTNFFLNYADEDLSYDELTQFIADSDSSYSKEYLKLNSHTVQKNLLLDPNQGRQIGNLAIKNPMGALIESTKFDQIFGEIKDKAGRVAIYSSYYHNGILQFAGFLDRHGFKDSYVVLTPELSSDELTARLELYNNGGKRILLIHPEITEGISLKETEQFHILEPVPNIALLDQIIGRAVRYQSHHGLPPNRRKVAVYLWESTINYGFFSEANRIRRTHWQKRYAEVNPNLWSKGILELDTNYFRKDESPDTRVKRNQHIVTADMNSFAELIKEHSIEKPRAKT